MAGAVRISQHTYQVLLSHFGAKTAILDCAAYLNAFLSIPQLREHRVIGVAHSGGCTVWSVLFSASIHAYARTPAVAHRTSSEC